MTRQQITSLILLGASVIYDFVPADFIPDVPLIGWVDDILVTSSAFVNCLQQFLPEASLGMQKLLRLLKWACIVLFVIVVLLVVLLAGAIVSYCK